MATIITRPRRFSWDPTDDVDAISTLPSLSRKGGEPDLSPKVERSKLSIVSRSLRKGSRRSTKESVSKAEPDFLASLLASDIQSHNARTPRSNEEIIGQINAASTEQKHVSKQLKKIVKAWVGRRALNTHATNLSSRGFDGNSPKNSLLPPGNPNYAMLIGLIILQRPKKRRSAKGICKDIMKQNEWYNKNRHGGWQASISKELSQNSDFEAISVRRIGRATEAMKWQLSSTRYHEIVSQFQTVSTTYSTPSPSSVLELAASTALCELPDSGIHVDRHELMQRECPAPFEVKDTTPRFLPEPSKDEHFPYSWGLGHLSNSLYENQFPVSLGGVGSSLASGYSVLGSISTSKGKGKALEPYKRRSIEGLNTGASHSSTGFNYHAPSQNHGQSSRHNNGNVSSSASESVSQQPFKSTEENENQINGSNEEDGDRDDDEDGNNRKRKRFKSPDEGQDKGRFTCPYHLHDPATYGTSDRRYERCALTRFQYISALDRHLIRTHDKHICNKCMLTFPNKRSQDDHFLTCTQRSRRSQEESWRCIWRAIFPGVPEPSPYLVRQSRSPGPSTERASNARSSSSSTPLDTMAASNIGSTNPVTAEATNSKENDLIAHDATAFLKMNFQLLEIRVGSLERRLPLVERTTTSLQSLISTKHEASKKAQSLRTRGMTSSQSSSCEPYSTSSANQNGSKRLFGTTENAGLQEQSHLLPTDNECLPFVSSTTTRAQTDHFFEGNGKQPSRLGEDSPTSTLIDDLELEGRTLCQPVSGNSTQLCFDAGIGHSQFPKNIDLVDVRPNKNSRGPCPKCDATDIPYHDDVACQCPVFSLAFEQFLKDMDRNGVAEAQDIVMMDDATKITPDLWSVDLFGLN